LTAAENTLMSATVLPEKIATICLIAWEYLTRLVLPISLSIDSGPNIITVNSMKNFLPWLSALVHFALIVIGIRMSMRKKLIGFCLLFYFISMALYTNIVFPVGVTVGERFLYTPSFAFALLLALLLARIPHQKYWYMAILAILIFFTGLLFKRIPVWKNNDILMHTEVMRFPQSARLNYYAGMQAVASLHTLTNNQKIISLNKAEKYFLNALALLPNYPLAKFQLALVKAYQGDYNQARILFNSSIMDNPENAEAYDNLGTIYYKINKQDSAIIYYEKSLALNPGNINSRKNLILLLIQKNDLTSAERLLKSSREIAPGSDYWSKLEVQLNAMKNGIN
jgi:tetratricopeptide (TPR) repeat protein